MLASFSSQHVESEISRFGNPKSDSTKPHYALVWVTAVTVNVASAPQTRNLETSQLPLPSVVQLPLPLAQRPPSPIDRGIADGHLRGRPYPDQRR